MPDNSKCNFEYHVPETVDETIGLLCQYGKDAKVIAGGTDLIPAMKGNIARFKHLISLKRLEELKSIEVDDKGLQIGAMATLRDVETYSLVKQKLPALYTGIWSMANTQVKNRGTVVGNICNAVPSADTAPALIVYDASVSLLGAGGKRVVPIAEFFTGVCMTVLQPDELVTGIQIPLPKDGVSSVYYKYTILNALDLAMVGVASNISMDSKKVCDAKIALGAVAITPKRATHAEALICGQMLTDELINEAAKLASEQDCTPITDIRATADYRREMVRLHVRDALRLAIA